MTRTSREKAVALARDLNGRKPLDEDDWHYVPVRVTTDERGNNYSVGVYRLLWPKPRFLGYL